MKIFPNLFGTYHILYNFAHKHYYLFNTYNYVQKF